MNAAIEDHRESDGKTGQQKRNLIHRFTEATKGGNAVELLNATASDVEV